MVQAQEEYSGNKHFFPHSPTDHPRVTKLYTVGIAKEAGTYCPNADLGHADAQHYIGDIYNYGKYAKNVDRVRAWVWYSLAIQNGDAQAVEQVVRVTAEMTSEQLEEAKRQLGAWKPGQCMQELTPDEKEQEVQ